jgi:hypothetical protein
VTNIPFFWTAQYGKSIRYAGHGIGVDETLIDDLGGKFQTADPSFIAYYGSKGKVVRAIDSELFHFSIFVLAC